jgi:hypothetical protein
LSDASQSLAVTSDIRLSALLQCGAWDDFRQVSGAQVGVGPAQSFEKLRSKLFLDTATSHEFETLSDASQSLAVTSDIRLSVLLQCGAWDDFRQVYVAQVGVGPPQSFEKRRSKLILATATSHEFETLSDSTQSLAVNTDI